MEGLKIVKITLDPKAAGNVLRTALNAGYSYGIGYWANVRRVVTLAGEVRAIRLDETDGGKTHYVTQASIERAVNKILADPKGTGCDGWAVAIVKEEYPDGPMADAIIQVACFGEIKYA